MAHKISKYRSCSKINKIRFITQLLIKYSIQFVFSVPTSINLTIESRCNSKIRFYVPPLKTTYYFT